MCLPARVAKPVEFMNILLQTMAPGWQSHECELPQPEIKLWTDPRRASQGFTDLRVQ